MNLDSDKIWITWERQRRSLVLAEQFSAKYFVYDYLFSNFMFRYIVLSLITLRLLIKEKPKYVFCQNPSLILAFLLCLIKVIFGYVLIVDRHSNFRFGKQNKIVDIVFNLISNYTIKKADLTIVTNNYLCNLVCQKGGRGAVLEDKLPDLTLGISTEMKGDVNVVLVSSFSRDEPLDEVINSFEGLEGYHLYVTGNYKKHAKYLKLVNNLPNNITFTGYLSELEYQSLLKSSDIIIVLTTHEHTLTCGAYEGVALGKPLILSDTEAIRNYFRKGVVYTKSDRNDIRENLINCVKNIEKLKNDIIVLRVELDADWKYKFMELKKLNFIQ